MIPTTPDPGPARASLVSATREINVKLENIGSPDLPALRRAWFKLDADLDAAKASGDDAAAHKAVTKYRDTALLAIEKASR